MDSLTSMICEVHPSRCCACMRTTDIRRDVLELHGSWQSRKWALLACLRFLEAFDGVCLMDNKAQRIAYSMVGWEDTATVCQFREHTIRRVRSRER